MSTVIVAGCNSSGTSEQAATRTHKGEENKQTAKTEQTNTEIKTVDKIELKVPINKSQQHIMSGDIEDKIPNEIRTQWEEAKNKLNETIILKHNGKWYIHPKKGYLVDRIEVNGHEGIVILAKASSSKAEGTFPTLAEGYDIDSLKVGLEEECNKLLNEKNTKEIINIK